MRKEASIFWATIQKAFLATSSFLLLVFPFLTTSFAAEQITLTTYYPAPFGAYDRVRLVPHDSTADPITCDADHEGMLYYDSNELSLFVCGDDGTGSYEWFSLTPTIWSQNGDLIYLTEGNSNPNLKVGIGTDTPKNKLDVAGGVVIGSAVAGSTTVFDGTLLVQGMATIGSNQFLDLLTVVPPIGQSNSKGITTGRLVVGMENGACAVGRISQCGGGSGTSGINLSNGNMGLNVIPKNRLDIDGNVAIGSSFGGNVSAPTDGLLVEGAVGIGTSAPQNKVDVNGGVVVGSSYAGTETAPADGLLVEGQVGIGTASPSSSAVMDVTDSSSGAQCLLGKEETRTFTCCTGTKKACDSDMLICEECCKGDWIPACFAGDTLIEMIGGKQKQIEKIKKGEFVKGFDIGRKEVVYVKVKKIYSKKVKEYYVINNKIRVTAEHPFYTKEGWKKVKNLTSKDFLFDGRKLCPIKKIEKIEKPLTVYNMTVSSPNNYFAEGILAHNKNPDMCSSGTNQASCSAGVGVGGSCSSSCCETTTCSDTTATGIKAVSPGGSGDLAGDFEGDVNISQNLTVQGMTTTSGLKITGLGAQGQGSITISGGNFSVDGNIIVGGGLWLNGQKACGAAVGGSIVPTLVPNGWTKNTCQNYASAIGGTSYYLMCIFSDSYSIGNVGGGLPSPNCGWVP